MSWLRSGAAVLAAVLSVMPAARAATPHFPVATIADLGSAKLIVQSDDAAMLCGVQIFVRAGLDRQPRAKSGLASLAAESIVRTAVDGMPLQERVTSAGGSLTYAIEGQYAHFYLESRPERTAELLGLFAKVLAAPDFSAAAVTAARAVLGGRIEDAAHNPLALGVSTFKRSFYVNSNAGLPELGSKAGLAATGADDVRAFYGASYRSGGAIVTAVGHVPAAAYAAAKEVIAALPAGTPAAAAESGNAVVESASRRVIAHGDTRPPWLVFGFPAPSPGTRDFSAMLVIEALLAKTLDEPTVTTASAQARRFGSLYLYDTKPAALVIYANGLNVDPNAAINQMNLTLAALSSVSLDAKTVKALSAVAEGMFLTRNVTLVDQAWMLGNFAIQGLAPDYANAALAGMPAVSGADVRRVINKYLKKYTLAIVLPRENQPGSATLQTR